MNRDKLLDRISIDPKVCFGRPCIRGHRIWVSLILDLLDNFNIKATFAVLGIVAEQHPELIRTIYEKGHEVASHAYSHKTLYELGKVKFEQEIKAHYRAGVEYLSEGFGWDVVDRMEWGNSIVNLD